MPNSAQTDSSAVYNIVREKIFDASPEAILILDSKGHVLSANLKLFRFVGYSPKDVIGVHLLELPFLSSKSKSVAVKNFALRMAGNYVPPHEVEMISEKGETKFGRLIGEVVRDNAGGIVADLVMISDITEQKIAQEALKEFESRYRSFIENSQGIAFQRRLGGELIFLQGAVEMITSHTSEELRQKKPGWRHIIVEDDQSKYEDVLKKISASPGSTVSHEYRVRRKNGQIRWVNEIIQNIRPEAGRQGYLQGMIFDVTVRKRAEEKVLESEKKYRNYVESAPYGMFVVNERNNFMDVNNQACKMTGFTKKELLSKGLQDIIAPRSGMGDVGFGTIAGREDPSVELPFITKEGERRTWSVKVVVLSETRFLGFATDITERKITEHGLKESEERHRNIFENAGVAFIYFDDVGNILDLNRWAVEMFGGKKENYLNRHFSRLGIFSAEDVAIMARRFSDTLKGKNMAIEARVKNKEGKEIDMEGTAARIKEGDALNIMLIARDVSERKKAQRLTEEKIEELKKANELMIGRELRVVELKKIIKNLEGGRNTGGTKQDTYGKN